MLRFFNKRLHNRKGFTLIELIVVIAILGILALIAVPRFAGIRGQAQVKAEAATAEEIITALRVYESNENLPGAADLTNAATLIDFDATFYSITSGGGPDVYVIGWTSTATGYAGDQSLTENAAFTPVEY